MSEFRNGSVDIAIQTTQNPAYSEHEFQLQDSVRGEEDENNNQIDWGRGEMIRELGADLKNGRVLDLSGSYAIIPCTENQAYKMSRSANSEIDESLELSYDYV